MQRCGGNCAHEMVAPTSMAPSVSGEEEAVALPKTLRGRLAASACEIEHLPLDDAVAAEKDSVLRLACSSAEGEMWGIAPRRSKTTRY
jgi:hypothetical protein